MSFPAAPLRIPVEIRRAGGGPRWFRLASYVSEQGLVFARALPEECDGPLRVAFHLPEDPERLSLEGRAISADTGDTGASGEREREAAVERLAVRFIGPDEASRARIARYVADRLPRPGAP
jgi:hypothetical protein